MIQRWEAYLVCRLYWSTTESSNFKAKLHELSLSSEKLKGDQIEWRLSPLINRTSSSASVP